ncbi:MAG TPA: 50S ribosomal protein L23 [Candidatus Nanoarchaeia archaeon]|nr:50S ribosomal protein L23 [Candidatus Nanoarchaeia archaeon]
MKLNSIIKYPLATEKAIRFMDKDNKLVFVVDLKAKKDEIKKAVESAFNVKVDTVNTFVTSTGEKRAYVKLSSNNPAIDVMTKMGLM